MPGGQGRRTQLPVPLQAALAEEPRLWHQADQLLGALQVTTIPRQETPKPPQPCPGSQEGTLHTP